MKIINPVGMKRLRRPACRLPKSDILYLFFPIPTLDPIKVFIRILIKRNDRQAQRWVVTLSVAFLTEGMISLNH